MRLRPSLGQLRLQREADNQGAGLIGNTVSSFSLISLEHKALQKSFWGGGGGREESKVLRFGVWVRGLDLKVQALWIHQVDFDFLGRHLDVHPMPGVFLDPT